MKAIVMAVTMLIIGGPAHAQTISAADVYLKCLDKDYSLFCSGFVAASSMFLLEDCRASRREGDYTTRLGAAIDGLSVRDVMSEFMSQMNEAPFFDAVRDFPAIEAIRVAAFLKWPCEEPLGLSERDPMNGLGLSLGE